MSKESRNLILFFSATFVATYAAYLAIILKGWNPYAAPGLFFFLIGGSAPTWVGLLIVFFRYDQEQRKNYFKRLLPRLIPGRWWAITVLIFPAAYVVIIAINQLLGGALPGMEQLKAYIARPTLLLFAMLMGLGSGPISEEFGWRGFALDPLMRMLGRFYGATILGLIWGIWHLPLFFMPQTWHGQIGFQFSGFYTFMLMSVGLTWIMTWVHLNTQGSILAAILLHFFSNFTSSAVLPVTSQVDVLHMVVLFGLGVAVYVLMERTPLDKLVMAR